MTDREVIERLKTTAPRVELTLWQKAARVLAGVFAGVAVLALVTAVYAVQKALVASKQAVAASQSALHVSVCVNTVIGLRSAPTAADALAHIAFAESLERLVATKPSTPAEQAAAVADFRRSTATYAAVLIADQKTRTDHPLGKC